MGPHITCRIMIPVNGRIINGREKTAISDVLPETNRSVSPGNKKHKTMKDRHSLVTLVNKKDN